MKFSIVVPAYNEEQSVRGVLERCARAAERIRKAGLGVDAVEIILVNDGSTDRTEELARSVPGVSVASHAVNRGYGAALKTGLERASGEVAGFLDADGTCDPDFFEELLRALQRRGLDVVSGSRLHPRSRMPAVRRLGNRLFRSLVNCFGGPKVSDVASGMRVVRRKALPRLYPLPDGLDFTPAMTVRAVLDPGLTLGEVPMPYEERVGRSKLNVLKDGARFLSVILDTAVTYRPTYLFGAAAVLLAALSVIVLCFPLRGPSAPAFFYLKERRVEDWMIFRIVLATVWLSLAAFLGALGTVAQSLTAVINREGALRGPGWPEAVARRLAWWGTGSIAFSLYLNRRPILSYWRTGHIPNEYWVFPVAGSLFALVGAEFIAFGLTGRIARLLRERDELYRADDGG